jgi:hypothetical protein
MLCNGVIVLHETENNKKTAVRACREDFYHQ